MPEICRFLGIVIAMYHNEHDPPHFHARYAGQDASILISSLGVLRGALPPRILGLVTEWAVQHRAELAEDWDLLRAGRSPLPIAPLQ